MMPWARAALTSWAAPGRAAEARIRRPAASATLHVHAVPLVLSGAVGLLVGDAVDGDQGAVEDGVGEFADSGRGRVQVAGGRGEQVDGFADGAPGGGHADGE